MLYMKGNPSMPMCKWKKCVCVCFGNTNFLRGHSSHSSQHTSFICRRIFCSRRSSTPSRRKRLCQCQCAWLPRYSRRCQEVRVSKANKIQLFCLPYVWKHLLNNESTRCKQFISEWPTIPQLYVNGEFIGGCDIVMQMHESGELAELLKEVKQD